MRRILMGLLLSSSTMTLQAKFPLLQKLEFPTLTMPSLPSPPSSISSPIPKRLRRLLLHRRRRRRRRRAGLIGVADAFSLVGKDLRIDDLLDACEAFLELQRSMGSSNRLVADDFQRNLDVARAAYESDPRNRQTLRALLDDETYNCGMHTPAKPGVSRSDDGTVASTTTTTTSSKLSSPSGSCALLWMRRSVDFHRAMFYHVVTNVSSPIATAIPAATPSSSSLPMASHEKGRNASTNVFDSSGTSTTQQAHHPIGSDLNRRRGRMPAPKRKSIKERVPVKAALLAYGMTLERYHNWPLQQAYKVGLARSMPPTRTFLNRFSYAAAGGTTKTAGQHAGGGNACPR